jgi:hypothetical protein
LRHDQRQRDMNDQEQHDRGHAEKMHEPCGLKVVEQRRELRELHRLPDRETGEDDEDTDQHDADVKKLLHGVVAGEVVVLETKGKRIADGRNKLVPGNGKELAPEPAADNSINQIGQPVEHHYPHSEKVPLQSVLRPGPQ